MLEKQQENLSLDRVLADCRAEGIQESDMAEVLDSLLTRVQAKKRSEIYWDQVRAISAYEMPLLDANQAKAKFLEDYQLRFGKKFILDEFSEPLINLLSLYFTNDPRFEKSGYSLKKGILLHGNVGTGKSSILNTFGRNQKQSFRMMPCLNLGIEFSKSKNGYDAMELYVSDGSVNRSPREYWQQQRFTWCFDDLGVESEKKHFGNDVNVMAELIQMIYDRQKLIGNIHFTTNLGADQITEFYGQRVASRLREMVNIIEFKSGSPDRRI